MRVLTAKQADWYLILRYAHSRQKYTCATMLINSHKHFCIAVESFHGSIHPASETQSTLFRFNTIGIKLVYVLLADGFERCQHV